MSTRKNLSALPSGVPQQPLSRGRGLRLSRAAKQALELAPKPSVAPDPSVLPKPPAPIAAPPKASRVAAETPIEAAAVASESLEPERKERKIQLRKDLLKQAKRIARTQDRKLFQVIESALEEYIQRHGASE